MTFFKWRTSLWLLLSTVLIPAALTVSVGILILVFYRESWDVAFGVLVLCFAVFALTGSASTIYLLRRAGRLAQMQTEFLANMSHELRTPLTAIRLFVETLRQRKLEDQEERRCLDTLGLETERMERMVNRVLTFRQLSQSGAGPVLEPYQASELVREALAPWTAGVADGASARVELVVEPELPRILAHPDTLMEAIRNLVGNALKFSSGAVVVNLRHDGEGVAISVRDQGPAIPGKERKRIFKRFYRIDEDKPGSGLGLAIASKAAEAHGGSLGLKSTKGMGNVFTLRLPLVEPTPDPSPRPATAG